MPMLEKHQALRHTAEADNPPRCLPMSCFGVLQGSRHQQMIQEEELRRVDLRRRMRATVVPTSDAEVRRLLRQLGEPVTLFGEQQVSRQLPVTCAVLRKRCAAYTCRMHEEQVNTFGGKSSQQPAAVLLCHYPAHLHRPQSIVLERSQGTVLGRRR